VEQSTARKLLGYVVTFFKGFMKEASGWTDIMGYSLISLLPATLPFST
jgi:hypothetical protein